MSKLIYIMDLEGTLTHSKWRSPYAKMEDWKRFHKLFPLDEPNWEMINLCNDIALSGRAVWILTGKEESGRADAIEWLKSHGVQFSYLFMRPQGNRLSSPDFKERFIMGECSGVIAMLYDDRQDVIDMARSHNIPAILSGDQRR